MRHLNLLGTMATVSSIEGTSPRDAVTGNHFHSTLTGPRSSRTHTPRESRSQFHYLPRIVSARRYTGTRRFPGIIGRSTGHYRDRISLE